MAQEAAGRFMRAGRAVVDLPPSRPARPRFSRRPRTRSVRIFDSFRSTNMGKGDRKTAKGKRYNSSYGNARSASAVTKAAGTAAAPVAKKAAAKTVAKAP